MPPQPYRALVEQGPELERDGVPPSTAFRAGCGWTSTSATPAIEEACAEAGLPGRRMISRAYRDRVFMARTCPAAMIFVPSSAGVSHRPDEYTSPHEIAQGAAVLAGALRRLAA